MVAWLQTKQGWEGLIATRYEVPTPLTYWRKRHSLPVVRAQVKVEQVARETPTMVTLRFAFAPVVKPGQFVMVWVPGDDEIPMSLSYLAEGELKGFTVKAIGPTTRHLAQLKEGDFIGIRGPYGNGFELGPKRVLVVAGGSGAAMLAPAAESVSATNRSLTVALGATSSKELLFKERFKKAAGKDLHISTDDGSEGTKGFVTDLAKQLMTKEKFDAIWTCGPEIMMRGLLKSAKEADLPILASVERVMKCAIDLCDSCAMGPYHVCSDGPVFTGEALSQVEDFGRFKRDNCGRRVSL
jgi:dihydroorotate dehydrogenase electron transfer subunit